MTRTRAVAVVAAVAAGAVQVLAHPPYGWSLLALLAPALLATAITVSDLRPGLLGFVAGLALYVPLLAWLRFRATVVAWILLALIMAAWMALLAKGLHWLLQRSWGLALAPLWWVGIDAWRNEWPWGGFGWATLGITQVDNGWMVPLGRILGEKGHTLVVVTLSLCAWSAVRTMATQRDPDAARPALLGLAGTMLAVALVPLGPPPVEDRVDVLAVQPNDIEFPGDDFTAITRRLAGQAVDLTRASFDRDGPADLTVWPEGSIGRDPDRDPVLSRALADAGALTDGRLLVGTDREDPDSDRFRRVSVVVDEDGAIVDTYVKQDLVPFGEYIPLRSLFDWYPALDQIARDAIASTSPDNVVVPGPDGEDLSVAVAICFETLHPGTVRANVLAGTADAQLLVASTSSSSYGRSGQPEQHLAQSRMRAIETGRYVAHVTSSGVTAFVDQDGRVLTELPELFTQATVRQEVGLVTGATPFLTVGDVLDPATRIIAAVLVGLLVLEAVRRRRDAGAADATGAGPAGGDTVDAPAGATDDEHHTASAPDPAKQRP